MSVRSVPSTSEGEPSQTLGDVLVGLACPGQPRGGHELPCRFGDADLWFAENPADLERAKAACGPCPVRAECLAGAIARSEPWGVWGGEILERGSVIARKRPRGRPSKADLTRDAELAALRDRELATA